MNDLTEINLSLFEEDFSEFYDLLNGSDYVSNQTFEVDSRTVTCEASDWTRLLGPAVCAFYVLVFLLAIPGNCVVGLVISSGKRPFLPFDLYLIHLAVADALLALTLPFWATAAVAGWIFGNTVCKLLGLVQEATFYSSILFLACISADRYQVVVRAVEARRESRQGRCWAACFAVWAVGGALSLPALFNESFRPGGSEVAVCTEYYDPDSAAWWRLATRVLRHLLGFLLPLAFMLVCYGRTAARLLHTQGSQKRRAVRMMAAVLVAFFACWAPYHLSLMVDTLLRAGLFPYGCTARTSVYVALFSTQSVGLLHCCINPILYAFVGERFRRNLRKLLEKKGVLERARPPQSGQHTSQSSENTSTFL
ncbi:C-X-C chemokine receptor type 1-like isoform X1 [Conger conger]|uniref:C-X-C chemokine receptor type 1-like isoform X1 n=1 Tax=Conger conger TaxID=82655 RepID=UPI002A5AE0B0|nr:C-X-C chemokine receptor type 1-like isoform X1 [Conger conger]